MGQFPVSVNQALAESLGKADREWDRRLRYILTAWATIATSNATLRVQRAPHDMLPVRWLLHRSATRPPRVAPSIVALLTAVRNALGGEGGNRVRIGGSA